VFKPFEKAWHWQKMQSGKSLQGMSVTVISDSGLTHLYSLYVGAGLESIPCHIESEGKTKSTEREFLAYTVISLSKSERRLERINEEGRRKKKELNPPSAFRFSVVPKLATNF
jgi:hypothetical protein